jgi:hypothetical protein
MAENDSKFTNGSERSSDEILNDIAARRESISHTVGQIEEKIHQTMDWKSYVERYPYATIGLAVGTGLLLAGLLRRKRSPTERIVDAFVEKAGELGEDLRDAVGRLLAKTAAPTIFRGTIYGMAGKALMQYLQNRATHAEGNGGNYSHEDWRDFARSTSTPPNVHS